MQYQVKPTVNLRSWQLAWVFERLYIPYFNFYCQFLVFGMLINLNWIHIANYPGPLIFVEVTICGMPHVTRVLKLFSKFADFYAKHVKVL